MSKSWSLSLRLITFSDVFSFHLDQMDAIVLEKVPNNLQLMSNSLNLISGFY